MPITLTRSLLTIIVPGIIASAPWLLYLSSLGLHLKFPQHPVLISGVALAVVTIIGAIFEGMGSWLELRWDTEREATFDVRRNWYLYLASRLDPQPVGYEYLTKLVTTFYFELAMMFAASVSIVGIGAYAWRMNPDSGCVIAPASLLTASLAALYFKWQAKCTHKVLCETRFELNRLIGAEKDVPSVEQMSATVSR